MRSLAVRRALQVSCRTIVSAVHRQSPVKDRMPRIPAFLAVVGLAPGRVSHRWLKIQQMWIMAKHTQAAASTFCGAPGANSQ
jgi:hypothetical protein